MPGEVAYGFKLAVITQIDPATGLPPSSSPKTATIKTPQQASFTPQVVEGNRAEQRGGDGLLCTIEEDATFIGMDITFSDAILDGAAMEIIAGGTWDSVDEEYTSPSTSEKPKPFKMELYQALYDQGSNMESSIVGYRKWTFNYVSGRTPSSTMQDRNYFVPQFALKCRENLVAGLNVFTHKIIEASELPS